MARRFNKKSKTKHATKTKYKEIDEKIAPTILFAKKMSLTREYEKIVTAHLCFKYREIENEVLVVYKKIK